MASREEFGIPSIPPVATMDESHSAKHLPAKKRAGIALCLSGGGYRAALFHLGALRRLNEFKALGRLDTISSVSGGSIVSAFLADKVAPWPQAGDAADPEHFEHEFCNDLEALTQKNIRTLWAFARLLPWNWSDSTVAVKCLQRRYAKEIRDRELAALPQRPRFIICATDMSFGVNWVSERERIGSYQAGYAKPTSVWTLSRAVAASSCFPPVFDPMPIEMDRESFSDGDAEETSDYAELINKLRLSDGGVYDNMGLEPVWKDHAAVLVSDGGATFDFAPDRGFARRLGRYLGVQGNQAAALRKRWLIANFEQEAMDGAYWGIGSSPESYGFSTGYSKTLAEEVISEIRTDLDCFSEAERGVLENHGYCLADAAIRKHQPHLAGLVDLALPYPQFTDEEVVERELATSNRRKLLGRWRRPTLLGGS